ncbi:MAG: gamma-glutamyltransferase [Planctomycetota bacterium]
MPSTPRFATALVLAVTYPQAGNLGGGGFMLISMADGRRVAIDYREMAPARAQPNMFLNDQGLVDAEVSRLGYRAAGIPGTPAGLDLAHRMFGGLPREVVAEPAIRLARDGFVVSDELARSLAANAKELARFPASAAIFLHQDGAPYRAGEVLRQPDLAASLEAFARDGARPFYEGTVAEQLVAAMSSEGGLWSRDDLARYQALRREPLVVRYREHELLLMPPPSSGGIALGQILAMLEPFQLREWGGRTDPAVLHLLAEAMRRAFADRASYVGDPDFVPVPARWLLSPEHIQELRASIAPEHASDSKALGPPLSGAAEPTHTTHFSVVDAQRNVVSNTYTLEEWFGCKAVVPGTGILLNNELHDFNMRPGVTDRDGAIGTAANQIAPFKRPLSSMTPVIALRAGKPRLVTGSPGGRTIINTVAAVVLGVLEFGLEPRAAVDAPRLHQQWFPDRIQVEATMPAAVIDALRQRGHAVEIIERLGDAHTIVIDDDGQCHAAADARIAGWAAGY